MDHCYLLVLLPTCTTPQQERYRKDIAAFLQIILSCMHGSTRDTVVDLEAYLAFPLCYPFCLVCLCVFLAGMLFIFWSFANRYSCCLCNKVVVFSYIVVGSTWWIWSVHSQVWERHWFQAELVLSEATGRWRQNTRILRGVESRHWDGTHHGWNRETDQSLNQTVTAVITPGMNC